MQARSQTCAIVGERIRHNDLDISDRENPGEFAGVHDEMWRAYL
jgi:hypothetical protein